MSSTKAIKQRIHSVRNTAQITKAMEMVSAAKMRKSQEFAIRARPYARSSLEMLKNLFSHTPTDMLPPLLASRPVKNSALLVVTSDKGLAGAFNSNVVKKAEIWVANKKNLGADYTLITVGKKARDYFSRRNHPIQESFTGFGDYSTSGETLPVAESIIRGFTYGVWNEVEVAYTKFRSTLKQEAVIRMVLPVTERGVEEMVEGILPERGRYAIVTGHSERSEESPEILRPAVSGTQDDKTSMGYRYEYKFEPSASEILESLVPQLIRMHVHHIILESNASEHSARMVAMKNASESASDLIQELSLEYNKSRQAQITRELVEITAGKEALE